MVLEFENTGVLDATIQVYYVVDIRKVPDSDLETSRLEDDLYSKLSAYMGSTKAVSNTIPTGAERFSEQIPADLTDEQQRKWKTSNYAIYYIGEIKYQDTEGAHFTRFCVSARNTNDVLSCRRYNEEP